MAIKYSTEAFIEKLHSKNRYDVIPLDEYINTKTKIRFQCQCGNIWKTTPNTILAGKGCPICGKKKSVQSRQLKEKFLNNLQEVRPDLFLISEYKTQHDPVELQCLKGHIWHVNIAQNALKPVMPGESGCPYCNGRFLTKENSFGAIRPDLIQYLKNPEDANNFSAYSSQKIIFKCPECGNEEEKIISHIVKSNNYNCSICSDNISYPNKFLRAFLKELKNKEYIKDYTLEYKINNYFLDGYFIYNNQKYGIEMQGIQHYTGKFKAIPIKEQLRRDEEKRLLCKEYNIKEIEINCSNSIFNSIKNEIYISELNNLFNLELLDWQSIADNSINNYIKIAADLFNKGYTVGEIMQRLSLSRTTINSYLHQAEDLGWCIYEKWRKINKTIKENK